MKRVCALTVIVIMAAIAGTAAADSLSDAVGSMKQKSSQFYSDGVLPESVMTGASQRAVARESMDAVESTAFQEKIQNERERLKTEVFGLPTEKKAYYADAKKDDGTPHLGADERVYLFVSSSMPEATLRAYVQDIGALRDRNIVIVMRGFIGGIEKAMPTLHFMSDLLKVDPRCTGMNCARYQASFEIDPNLYRRFKPERVPALVYARGVNPLAPDMSEGVEWNVSTPSSSSWWMIYGDASLSYLLSRVAEDAKAPNVEAMAEIIKK